MYYGNRKSKILHNQPCRYVDYMEGSNIVCFHDLDTALKKGYTLCSVCSGKYNNMANEKKKRESWKPRCVKAWQSEEKVHIVSSSGEWYIQRIDDTCNALFHRNILGNTNEYHLQKMISGDIFKIMKYISQHDEYRDMNPL